MQREQMLVTYEYGIIRKNVYIFKLLVRFPIRRYLSLSCLKLFLVRNGPIKTKEIFLKYPFLKALYCEILYVGLFRVFADRVTYSNIPACFTPCATHNVDVYDISFIGL